jgi:hypothetical protein
MVEVYRLDEIFFVIDTAAAIFQSWNGHPAEKSCLLQIYEFAVFLVLKIRSTF